MSFLIGESRTYCGIPLYYSTDCRRSKYSGGIFRGRWGSWRGKNWMRHDSILPPTAFPPTLSTWIAPTDIQWSEYAASVDFIHNKCTYVNDDFSV